MIDIVKAVSDDKAKKIKVYPCNANRASSIGYFVPLLGGCLRRGVYERTAWQQKELHDVGLQFIFDEGNRQEEAVLQDLAAAGVQVIEQQRPYEWKEHQITGHIDGKVFDGDTAIPVEIKSMSPNIFEIIHEFNDFPKKPWTRAYMAQITLYMLMQGCDKAIFILKNKSTGQLRQINCDLDYELGEACIQTAEEINKHVAAGTLPDQITDREKCKDCPFKLLCLPSISWGEELKIVDDPDFEKRVDEYMSKKATAKECDDVYEIIKDRAKAQSGGGDLNIICGKYKITGKRDVKGSLRTKIENLDTIAAPVNA